MRARDFILTEDPENIWDPPTPQGMTEEEMLTRIIPVLEQGRLRLLAHYEDWYEKEGVPLAWELGRLYLARNAAKCALELHALAPRADGEGTKAFGTQILQDIPFEPCREGRGPGGGTGYRSRAQPEETGEVPGEVEPGVFERTYMIPEHATKVVVQTTGQFTDLWWEMPDGQVLPYPEAKEWGHE